ncbi:MAG: cell division protein FtsQ/DivIB [Anaerolineae bacterium]
MRRFEAENPSVGVIVRQSAAWATLNSQRLPGLVLTLACLAFFGCLFGDGRFYVYGAEVSGNRMLPEQVLYEASGLDGMSVFFVSREQVRQRLLSTFPNLADVHISLGLPAQVRLRVSERAVAMAWEVGGQTVLADAQGRLLGSGQAPADGIMVRVSAGGTLPLSGQSLDLAAVETIIGLSQRLGARSFEYSERMGVAWRSAEGWPVYFGIGGDLGQKVAVMGEMLDELRAKGAHPEWLSVAVPSRPYYKE